MTYIAEIISGLLSIAALLLGFVKWSGGECDMGKPQDSDIVAELQGAGRDGKPTYYLRNCLLCNGFEITTQQLRSRLKYLEEKGVVRRTKSPFFKNNISWGLV